VNPELTPIESKIDEIFEKLKKDCPAFHYWSQHRILNYRVDFMVWSVAPTPSGDIKLLKFIIECDGHDFHEKTKQQVAYDKKRDRDLQALGFRVLRFSGSEIYKDPKACVLALVNQFEIDTNNL
jgi:very-short-patch-repair endonuclease